MPTTTPWKYYSRSELKMAAQIVRSVSDFSHKTWHLNADCGDIIICVTGQHSPVAIRTDRSKVDGSAGSCILQSDDAQATLTGRKTFLKESVTLHGQSLLMSIRRNSADLVSQRVAMSCPAKHQCGVLSYLGCKSNRVFH